MNDYRIYVTRDVFSAGIGRHVMTHFFRVELPGSKYSPTEVSLVIASLEKQYGTEHVTVHGRPAGWKQVLTEEVTSAKKVRP